MTSNPWREVIEIQVRDSLGGRDGEFDVPHIVTALIDKWGYGDIADIPYRDYWDVVLAAHHAPATTNGEVYTAQ